MSKNKKKSKTVKQQTEFAETEEITSVETEANDEQTESYSETAEPETLTHNSPFTTHNYFWLASCFLITAVGAFLRFWQLELKPMHHDEGVNGFFLRTLFNEGVYKYDPGNYHGPTLYYIALAFTKVFGLETFAVRASVGVFGVLTIILVFFLRKYLGTIGSLAAGLILALSPGMVYISRYFIHEIFFVFCSLGIVMGILFFIEGRKAGIFAAAWMALLLMVCFLPSALILANSVDDANPTLTLILRIAFFAVEAAFVFFIMRYLLEWKEGRPIYLFLASASAALFFATKETAFVTIGTLLIACVCVWLWRKIYAGMFGEIKENELEPEGLNWKTFLDRLDVSNSEFFLVQSAVTSIAVFLTWLFVKFVVEWIAGFNLDKGAEQVKSSLAMTNVDYTVLGISILLLVVAVGISIYRKPPKISRDFILLSVAVVLLFLYVGALFFSSFFTYPEGIKKAFEAYAIWTKTGTGEHTQNGTFAYINWLRKVEVMILILSAIGTIIAFVKARHRFAMFAGLWAFGLFAAYTIIPYKTPWLALSFLLPMCLVAGYGINELAVSRDNFQKGLAALLMIVTVGFLGYKTYELNFLRYDDDRMPYVYAHTRRGFLDLIQQVEHYAEKSGKGNEATIEIVSPDYWSMPWYTRFFTHANYWGRIVPASTAEMIVAKKGEQDEAILREYSAHYKYAGTYPLRPGVDLYLLVRSDLADAGARDISTIVNNPGITP